MNLVGGEEEAGSTYGMWLQITVFFICLLEHDALTVKSEESCLFWIIAFSLLLFSTHLFSYFK